jgi:phage repressor protein C with HTH and peptisase S24 domain
MDFSGRLKLIRESLHLKQDEFATRIQCKKSTYGNWERGSQYPNAVDINKLLAAFPWISSHWLLTGEGEMKRGTGVYPLAETLKNADISGDAGEGFVKIPRYEVAASAGSGATIHSEQIVDHLSFKADWVHNALGVSVKALALINVTGDSMEPTLSEGDLILIDMSHHGVKDNAVYVLQLNGSLLVKRIQHKLDGSVIVKSDNAIYEPERVGSEMVDSLNIIGRVVWCGRRM